MPPSTFQRRISRHFVPAWLRLSRRRKELTTETAGYLMDCLLRLWNEDANRLPRASEPRAALFWRRVGYCVECLVSMVATRSVANARGVPADVYKALLRAHRKFTASRRPAAGTA